MKLLMLLCLLAAGQAYAQKVDIEADESADFSRYRTFRMGEGQLKSKSPSLNSDLTRRKIDTEIRKRLIEKGLREATGQADLNVQFRLGSARRNEVDAFPAGRYGRGTRRVVTQYTEGTLIIDLRDTGRRELVWRAVVVEDKSDPAKIADRLDEMVKKAIEKYPPKKK
ncbi:MAG TPA: DUF4136 domain-containing protein [Bryobacteraceae bacterium]|nr:DUF4136 domain-containing protein [Bryobacteraceae bacterium]